MITRRLDGDALYVFVTQFQKKMKPEIDNYNRNVASRLTKRAIQILDETRERPQEQGWRKRSRLTGTLAGRHGRTRSITGSALAPGASAGGGRQIKGVGWPRKDILDRRARHWRRLEFGGGPMKIPLGLFLRGGKPSWGGGSPATDRFITYREYISSEGLRRGTTRKSIAQRRARQRRVAPEGLSVLARRRTSFLVGQSGMTGKGIEAKHFIQRSWEETVGNEAEIAFRKWIGIIEASVGDFS